MLLASSLKLQRVSSGWLVVWLAQELNDIGNFSENTAPAVSFRLPRGCDTRNFVLFRCMKNPRFIRYFWFFCSPFECIKVIEFLFWRSNDFNCGTRPWATFADITLRKRAAFYFFFPVEIFRGMCRHYTCKCKASSEYRRWWRHTITVIKFSYFHTTGSVMAV